MQLKSFKVKSKVTSLIPFSFSFEIIFSAIILSFSESYLNSAVIIFIRKTPFYVKYLLLTFHKFKIGMSDVKISVKRLIKLKK